MKDMGLSHVMIVRQIFFEIYTSGVLFGIINREVCDWKLLRKFC